MPRYGGILNFGEFRGFTRDIVLWNLGAYFLLVLLHMASAPGYATVFGYLALTPALFLHGFIWQMATYPFIHQGVLNTAFELLSLWFLGAFLEATHGTRWLVELFCFSVLGAGIAGILLAVGEHATLVPLIGCWGGIFGLLIAFGVLYADMQFMMFPLPIMIKAKYLVAVYMIITIALLFTGERIFAFSQLGGALFGYLYIKFAPRRGIATAGRTRYFDWRNQYYRWKRKHAAKKFEVYMRKQNREIHFDEDGKYLGPDKDTDDRSKWN